MRHWRAALAPVWRHPHSERQDMMRKLFSMVFLAATACEAGAPPARPEDLRGPRLTQALPRPAMSLVRDDGQPLDFRADTKGTLTFLFFGYTNCPDVCPLHMANLASALRSLPAAQAGPGRGAIAPTGPAR